MTGLRVAMIGQRGVPATFGGIEHHVEHLGSGMAAAGHEVHVFCRPNYVERALVEHRKMRLEHVPTVPTKHLDAIAHSALSSVVALSKDFDIVHYHAVGPALASPISRFFDRGRVVVTVHALDADRAKWGRVARAALRTGSWVSAHVPDATIGVSRAIIDHYLRRYGRRLWHIPNGVSEPVPRPARLIADRFGLEPRTFVLYVGRFVPEKGVDLLVRAFRKVPTSHRLVLAGDSSFTDRYTMAIRNAAGDDPRILLPGYVFGDLLTELYSNAAAFVLPSYLEGLPLTLLEAASYGLPIVASRIPPHAEVTAGHGPGRRLFPTGSEAALTAELVRVLNDLDSEQDGAVELRERVLAAYRWPNVVQETLEVYEHALHGHRRSPRIIDLRETVSHSPWAAAMGARKG